VSGAPACPFCASGQVERVGQWGGQMITAQWRCRACGSYFEAVRDDFDGGPASVRIRRRIEWIDTDAAGIFHWTAVCRLAEAAEAALHTALGIEHFTFGATPRVSVQFDFKRSLRFNDQVETVLAVQHVGTTSVRYAVTVSGADGVVAEGHLTACLIARDTGTPEAWPEDVRRLLTAGGEQSADADSGALAAPPS
jgi:acyl-CoA thioesterase FadM